MPSASALTTEGLIKHNLADSLRAEIVSGALQPGTKIVEAEWASKFGVAQGSIREALNILAHDGFVTKQAGRSARVVNFSHADILQLYQIRGAIEGLAARLVATNNCDLSILQNCVNSMRIAVRENKPEELLDADLNFHLRLCELSGNRFLIEHSTRILLPLFAFMRIRVISIGQETSPWGDGLEEHQRIVDLLRDRMGEVAEQYVKAAMESFLRAAAVSWERRT